MKLCFEFGAHESRVQLLNETLLVALQNPALGSSYKEVWDFPQTEPKQVGDFTLLQSPTMLCGAVCLPIDFSALEATAAWVYEQIFKLSQGRHLHRIWQFIPAINAITDGLENYQAYNKGRAAAFEKQFASTAKQLIPAASGVGTCGKQLVLVFIAGHRPGQHLENPQQTPAYDYPEKYGPRPPSFARATVVPRDTLHADRLYVSGTASIRGSENIGSDLETQLTTTFENLAIMTGEYRKHAPTELPHQQHYRVYLRHARDYPQVHAMIEQRYRQPNDQFNYIVADICRAELDLEIELTLNHSSAE